MTHGSHPWRATRKTLGAGAGWAEEIGKTILAVGTAAEQVIKLAGQVRGWLPPGLGN